MEPEPLGSDAAAARLTRGFGDDVTIETVDMWVTDGGPKALEDLTREELISALKMTARQLSVEREAHTASVRMLGPSPTHLRLRRPLNA